MSLQAVDYLAPNAATEFVESLREYGFGVLKKPSDSPRECASHLSQLVGVFSQH